MDGEEHGSGGGGGSVMHSFDGNSGGVSSATKRKRSVSVEAPPVQAPPTKTAKTHSSHLQINYLVRQYNEILPMVSTDDTLPSVLQLLSDYTGVLERHESLAGNLGAKPLGPILIQRFERLFDGQPRVLKSHGKEGSTVSWLDVVDFARQKPEQFNLEKTRDGVRVCQFYTKQSRVEISEDDYTLIASGIPQKMIPPQPIPEDEEKELGTLEIMEKKIAAVIQLADQVSARARQTKHRVTARKHAIVSRREAEAAAENARASATSNDNDGYDSPGFRPVNSARPERLNGLSNSAQNGRSYLGSTASPTTHAELLNLFNSGRARLNEELQLATTTPTSARPPNSSGGGSSKSKSKPVLDNIDYAGILLNSASPVPIPSTPSTLVNQRPSQADRVADDSGPYKAEMLSRMENMARGERVMPPCDRCRRLHIDCLKNLTACLGCTKKHAKCSWKDVTKQELADNPFHPRSGAIAIDDKIGAGGEPAEANSEPVRDEELLGEDSDDEDDVPAIHAPSTGGSAPQLHDLATAAVKPETSVEPDDKTEIAPHLPNTDSTPTPPRPAAFDGAVERITSLEPVQLAEAAKHDATPATSTGPTSVSVAMSNPIEAMPQHQVERAAMQIIEKRLEERSDPQPVVNGFASVNQPAPAATGRTASTAPSAETNGTTVPTTSESKITPAAS